MAAIDEALKTANEMLVVLHAADLTLSFKNVESLYEKEDKIRRKNVKDAKEIIKQLQEDFENEENKASDLGQNSYSQAVFQKNFDSKKNETEKMTDEIQDLKNKEQGIKEKINETQAKSEQIEQKKQKLEKERMKIEQESKSIFDLYLQTTGIHWDFNGAEKEIKGFVAGEKDIKPFSLNTNDHGSFYTANYLWDLIDTIKGE